MSEKFDLNKEIIPTVRDLKYGMLKVKTLKNVYPRKTFFTEKEITKAFEDKYQRTTYFKTYGFKRLGETEAFNFMQAIRSYIIKFKQGDTYDREK